MLFGRSVLVSHSFYKILSFFRFVVFNNFAFIVYQNNSFDLGEIVKQNIQCFHLARLVAVSSCRHRSSVSLTAWVCVRRTHLDLCACVRFRLCAGFRFMSKHNLNACVRISPMFLSAPFRTHRRNSTSNNSNRLFYLF